MTSKKPFLEQIKETIDNREQIREDLVRNIETTKKIVEIQAKDILDKTKKSDFFKSKIIPLAESELTNKAIDVLNSRLKLKGTPVMEHIEKLRQDIINSQFENAKTAQEVPAETTTKQS